MTDAINGLKTQTTPFTAKMDSPYHVAMGKFRMLINMNSVGAVWDSRQLDGIMKKSAELSQAIMNTNDNIWATGTNKQTAVKNLNDHIRSVRSKMK